MGPWVCVRVVPWRANRWRRPAGTKINNPQAHPLLVGGSEPSQPSRMQRGLSPPALSTPQRSDLPVSLRRLGPRLAGTAPRFSSLSRVPGQRCSSLPGGDGEPLGPLNPVNTSLYTRLRWRKREGGGGGRVGMPPGWRSKPEGSRANRVGLPCGGARNVIPSSKMNFLVRRLRGRALRVGPRARPETSRQVGRFVRSIRTTSRSCRTWRWWRGQRPARGGRCLQRQRS